MVGVEGVDGEVVQNGLESSVEGLGAAAIRIVGKIGPRLSKRLVGLSECSVIGQPVSKSRNIGGLQCGREGSAGDEIDLAAPRAKVEDVFVEELAGAGAEGNEHTAVDVCGERESVHPRPPEQRLKCRV